MPSDPMFNVAYDRSFKNEGAFQKNPKDRGNWTSGTVGVGELKGTKGGISAMSYPDLDIENLTELRIKSIYERDWWDKLRMDRFPPAMQYQWFDAAINHGTYNATKILQRAINAKDDGVIGPKTMALINTMEKNDLLMNFLSNRLIFMTNAPTWDEFGKGWARRVALNLQFATQDN